MAKLFSILRDQSLEQRATERYFLETGQEFSKLPPTEQRKRLEVEHDRISERNISFVPGTNSNTGGAVIEKPKT